MAAGLAKEPYPVEWIVDLCDARAPKAKETEALQDQEAEPVGGYPTGPSWD